MIYHANPRTYHRMTQKSIWTDKSRAYIDWKKDLQSLGFGIPNSGAIVVFRVPMPKSWSKAKKNLMRDRAHTQRPDLSNLLKAAEDAARYGQPKGDQEIWHYAGLMKRWSEVGSIEVRVPLEIVTTGTA